MSKFDWQVLDRGYEDVIYETYNALPKSLLIVLKSAMRSVLKQWWNSLTRLPLLVMIPKWA
mgnify:CR=1 FL=1